jgi:hypothetical protein
MKINENVKKEKRTPVWILPAVTVLLVLLLIAIPKIITLGPTGTLYGNSVSFKWISITGYSYYTLLVDDNPEFTSPLIAETNSNYRDLSNISAGNYYWKIVGYKEEGNFDESAVNQFSIQPVVSLQREGNGLRNTGNVAAFLNLIKGSITGKAILDINSSKEIENDVKEVEASQK